MKKKIHSFHFSGIVRQALLEDVGKGDITSELIVDKLLKGSARIISRQDAVICGTDIARAVFRNVDPRACVRILVKDGDRVKAGQTVMIVSARVRTILTAERTALNFLGYLSGIATTTRAFVDEIKPFKAEILDTRKTTPTLRALERFAVLCGGGKNHRFNLEKMVLVKDNHRLVSVKKEPLDATVRRLRRQTQKKIEIEVDSIDELKEVLSGCPDMVLLDNMQGSVLKTAVKIVRALPASRRPLIEASGGITLKNVRSVAATGVDRISIGSLTHSRDVVDMSLELGL